MLDKGYDQQTLPSLGDAKMLVLPIDFSDRTCSNLAGGCNGSLERIKDGFFGERATSTEIQSVSSFYKHSSYNKLNIQGEIAPWYRYSKQSFSSLAKITDQSEQLEAVEAIIDEALAEYAKNHDITQYDTDGDENIDALWVIYSGEYDTTGAGVNWAFVTDSATENYVQGLLPYRYGWASYEFFDEGGYGDTPDAHTFVHETGHLLGLDDYYDYSDGADATYPAGGPDMMDFNIGDHHVFSKYLLGWVEPEVITSTKTITLKPFEETGECAIIGAPTYNGEAVSEYITLQYYTPTGLNKIDSETTYTGGLKTYSDSGLLMFHGDASFGKISKVGNTDDFAWDKKYIDSNFENIKLNDKQGIYYLPVHSNTPAYSFATDTSQKLYEILDNNPKNYQHDYYTSNKALYKAGDSFGISNYQEKTWHNGSLLKFSISVTKVTDEEMTLAITFFA